MATITDATTGSASRAGGYQEQILADRTAVPVKITVAAATARSAQLPVGTYEMISSTACYFRQGTVAVVATANDHYLPAGERVLFPVTNTTTKGYIAALQLSAGGTMFLTRLTSRV